VIPFKNNFLRRDQRVGGITTSDLPIAAQGYFFMPFSFFDRRGYYTPLKKLEFSE